MTDRVAGEERRIRRAVAAQGFDARLLRNAWFVRLLRPRHGRRIHTYQHAGVVLFQPVNTRILAQFGWAGWRVLGYENFAVPQAPGAVVVWHREIDGVRRHPPSQVEPSLSEPALSRFSSSMESNPFSEAEQRMRAGVEPLRAVSCRARYVLVRRSLGSRYEEICLFSASVDAPKGYGIPPFLPDGEILTWQDYEFWTGAVEEGAELWAFEEKSPLGLEAYLASLGFPGPANEVAQEGKEDRWEITVRWRVNLDRNPRVDDTRMQIDRAEARLMTLNPECGVQWEPDGEEVGGWYEWNLTGTSVEAVRFAVAKIVHEENLTLPSEVVLPPSPDF